MVRNTVQRPASRLWAALSRCGFIRWSAAPTVRTMWNK